MKILALALLLALAGCEGDTIKACAYARRQGEHGKRMLRWSASEGGVCEDGEKKTMKVQCHEAGYRSHTEVYEDMSPKEAAETFADEGDLSTDECPIVVVEPVDEEAKALDCWNGTPPGVRYRVTPHVEWKAETWDPEEEDRVCAAICAQAVRR